MSLEALTFRASTPADAGRIAELVVEGLAGYRTFAPAGWEPPALEQARGQLEEALSRPGVWAQLAEHGAELVGHVATVPAGQSRVPASEPALLHLWNLFVAPPWWGTALAARLHAAAVADARERGFAAIRLFTPAGQLRARRFYEREGWRAAGPPAFEEALGLDLVEYRLGL